MSAKKANEVPTPRMAIGPFLFLIGAFLCVADFIPLMMTVGIKQAEGGAGATLTSSDLFLENVFDLGLVLMAAWPLLWLGGVVRRSLAKNQ